jgi:hypothetical protein
MWHRQQASWKAGRHLPLLSQSNCQSCPVRVYSHRDSMASNCLCCIKSKRFRILALAASLCCHAVGWQDSSSFLQPPCAVSSHYGSGTPTHWCRGCCVHSVVASSQHLHWCTLYLRWVLLQLSHAAASACSTLDQIAIAESNAPCIGDSPQAKCVHCAHYRKLLHASKRAKVGCCVCEFCLKATL